MARAIELQDRITAARMAAYVGTEQDVLIDAANPRHRHAMNGRTDGFRPVTVRACDAEIGDMVRGRITDYKQHWLDGEVLAGAIA